MALLPESEAKWTMLRRNKKIVQVDDVRPIEEKPSILDANDAWTNYQAKAKKDTGSQALNLESKSVPDVPGAKADATDAILDDMAMEELEFVLFRQLQMSMSMSM